MLTLWGSKILALLCWSASDLGLRATGKALGGDHTENSG